MVGSTESPTIHIPDILFAEDYPIHDTRKAPHSPNHRRIALCLLICLKERGLLLADKKGFPSS